MDQSTRTDTALVAELNDLLMLDHDAVQAYTLAINTLSRSTLRESLRSFRADHERHIGELRTLIADHGGVALEMPHLPSGMFKLAVQAAAAAGGDVAVLLAYKANERQVRDKYRAAARRPHPMDIDPMIKRAAADEAVHYAWAIEALEELGYDADSIPGRAERAFEVAHKGVADAAETVERQTLHAAEGIRRTVTDPHTRDAIASALLALGTGFVAGQLFGRRKP